MKFLKFLFSLAIELLAIGLVLFVLFKTVFIGFSRLAGEAYSWLIFYFSIIFLIDVFFYIILRLVWNYRKNSFWKWLGIVLLALPIIFGLYVVATSTGGFKLFALPFLVPLFVFALRYLFLKILAIRKQKVNT